MLTVARRAWRTLALCGGLLLVACSSNGSYRIAWTFVVDSGFSPGDCGKYGVSAIAIAGTSQDGTAANPVAPCSPGVLGPEVPAGTWTLVLTALDAQGHVKEPTASGLLRAQTTVVVAADQLAIPQDDPVFLPPLPQCRDGVDNDCDGRVDLDDLECGGDAEGQEGERPQGVLCLSPASS